jgi:hypothetical protein
MSISEKVPVYIAENLLHRPGAIVGKSVAKQVSLSGTDSCSGNRQETCFTGTFT